MQGYKGRWHGLPLGRDGTSVSCIVTPGINRLPRDEAGEIAALIEHQDTGYHHFLLLTANMEDAEKIPDDLDRLPPHWLGEAVTVHLCLVYVRA